MARIPIIMPKMSMTMTEGEVASWMVKVGDEVAEGDVVAEVMTDKVDMEVESTHTGTLVEITVSEGMVNVGDPIGYLEGTDSGFGDLLGGDEPAQEPAEDPAPEPAAGQAADTDATPDVGGDVPADPPLPSGAGEPAGGSAGGSAGESAAGSPGEAAGTTEAPAATPAPAPAEQATITAAVPRARGLARELGLDLDQVTGTGPDGLVTVADVEQAGSPNGKAPQSRPAVERAPAAQTSPAPSSPAQTSPAPSSPAPSSSAETRPAVAGRAAKIRAAVARKMTESASVPQFTVWRELVLDQADARRGGLSWTTVLLQAYAAALRDVPELLCRWEDGAATPSGPPSVALAVATQDGLMVPVFVEPDHAAPDELDAELKTVVRDVQQGRLDPHYLGVANGSLSNLGGLGVDRFQALVTPPQASVLALGSIARRPAAVPGGIGTALMLSAGLTVDHRVADGAQGAAVLARFAAHLAGTN